MTAAWRIAMDRKPATVDEYLAGVPDDMRAALQQLREMLRALVPNAEEVISYQIPTLRYRGSLVGFGAAKNHCSFYVESTAVMDAFKDELASYDTAKATVHFQPDEPLPQELVAKLVRARMAENEARRKK
jgi:uncharacterized protein YdhG (YjbR/CyaY superfamily)